MTKSDQTQFLVPIAAGEKITGCETTSGGLVAAGPALTGAS